MKSIAFIFALLVCAFASESPPPMVNVKSYASASGRWSLEVDPTDLYGRGPARCVLMENGHEAWSKELPFTFSEAVVADDGTVAGYGYTEGVRGWAKGGYKAGPGDIRIAILDPSGGFRLDEKIPRHRTLVIHGGPEPTVAGIMLHEKDDRFTVRVTTSTEKWRVFTLSTGKEAGEFATDAAAAGMDSARYIVNAEPVAGTPLTLVHWWCYDDATSKISGLFTIVTLDGKRVWSLTRPGDYEVPGNEDAEDKLRALVMEKGVILDTKQPGKFEVWFPSEKQRVFFSIARDGDGWRVAETARRAYTPPDDKPAEPQIPERALEKLGTFTLDDKPAESPVRDVVQFEFDDRGRIGFLRREENAETFVLIEQTGKVLVEMPLKFPKEESTIIAWIAGDRWLITSSLYGNEARPRAYWLDVEKKTRTKIEGFTCPPVKSLAPTGDGGFVALATQHHRYTMTDQLIVFDAEGKQRWRKAEAGYSGKPDELLSPDAVTCTTKSEIALLDNIRGAVQFFDTKGRYLRTLDLAKAWKRKPNYPADISADNDGGFIVGDFDGKPPFVWMRANGTVREQFNPKFIDGRAVSANRSMHVAPDGNLWCSDGHAILKLNAKRTVTTILGVAAKPGSLTNISDVLGDSQGRLYAKDERTGALHQFDSEGRKLRVFNPGKDPAAIHERMTVAAANERTAELAKKLERSGYIRIAKDGTVSLAKKLGFDSVMESWFPRNNDMFALTYEAAYFVGSDGKKLRTITRRADRNWLANPDGAAVAGDGSFAITSKQYDERDSFVTFFSAAGEPLHTASLQGFMQLSGYNGKHAVFLRKGETLITDNRGKPVQRFSGVEADWSWGQFLTRDGRELWVIEYASRKVTRYAMPTAE